MSHDPARYPPDWPAISAGIRERDGHRCIFCGVRDKVVGYWDYPQPYPDHRCAVFIPIAPDTDVDTRRAAAELHGRRIITIVLAVAHLEDRNTMNADPANLGCLCQRCHLRHDRPDALRNASRTRALKRSAGTSSFDLETA